MITAEELRKRYTEDWDTLVERAERILVAAARKGHYGAFVPNVQERDMERLIAFLSDRGYHACKSIDRRVFVSWADPNSRLSEALERRAGEGWSKV